MRLISVLAFISCLGVLSCSAAVLEPERLLPPESLLLVNARDPGRLSALLAGSGPGRMWRDPAMKPFVQKFSTRWKEEFVQPLEREMGFRLEDVLKLSRGQATLALLPPERSAPGAGGGGWIFLMELGDQCGTARSNLTELAKKWIETGHVVRADDVGGTLFHIVSQAADRLPGTLREFLPRELEYHELGEAVPTSQSVPPREWAIGVADSLLVVAGSRRAAEQVVARLTGNALPNLAEQASFAADRTSLFRDAPLVAWLNAEPFLGAFARQAAQKKENPNAPSPVEAPRLDKVFAATGLLGIRSVAFAVRDGEPGLLLEWRVTAPEANRRGLLKLLVGVPKETIAPPFVPADVTQYRRWRIDGQQAWMTVEKMLSEFSPQAANVINFIFDTANMAVREKMPGFDVRKNLIGNLGDDLMVLRKRREGSAALGGSDPQLYLLGSPRAEELAAAMRSVLVFVAAQAGAPTEREFLGRKIYSVTLPAIPLMLPGAPSPVYVPRHLHYAASGSYVAFSTEGLLLEEYLRTVDSQANPLRQTPGLAEAAEKVVGPPTSMFSYHNHARSLRPAYEALRSGGGTSFSTNRVELLPLIPGMKAPERRWQDLADFSLLPPFGVVEKYIPFSVSGLAGTAEGLHYRVYVPPMPRGR